MAGESDGLQIIVDCDEQAVFALDRFLRYTAFNRAHAAIMRALYDADIEVGKSILDYQTVEEDRRVARQNLERALRGEPFIEETFSGEDAPTRHYFRVTHTPIRENGSVIGVAVRATDITEHKQAEEELRKSVALLATAESVAKLGSWRWHLSTHRVDWSDGMFRLFAVDPTGFDGDVMKVLSERVHPDDLAALQATTASVLETGEPVPVEYRLLLPDGSERIVRGEGKAERIAGGRPQAITGYCQDITDVRKSEQRLLASIVKQQTITEGVIAALAHTVDVRDPYTAGHQRRVSELAVAIARRVGLAEEDVRCVQIGGMLHDIGKIVIPAEILSKPGRLSTTEFELVKGHPQAAYDILGSIDFEHPIADVVAQHHERLDGSGYPAGLTEESILPGARILAVADVVEAMISHRPFRAALPLDAAMAELEAGAGSRYDAAACEAATFLFRKQGFAFSE